MSDLDPNGTENDVVKKRLRELETATRWARLSGLLLVVVLALAFFVSAGAAVVNARRAAVVAARVDQNTEETKTLANELKRLAEQNKTIGESNRALLDYIKDCTIVGGDCYAELARQGVQGSVRLMTFMRCVLTVEIPERSPELLNECQKDALEPLVDPGLIVGGGRR